MSGKRYCWELVSNSSANITAQKRPVDVVIKDMVVDTVGHGFDFQAGQIGLVVAYGLPPL